MARFIPFGLVFFGGALGSTLRYAISQFLFSARPLNTLLINLVGSFLIGVLARGIARDSAWFIFLLPGLLGGFTTFSAFSLEALMLLRENFLQGLGYMGASVLGGVLFCAVGYRAWA